MGKTAAEFMAELAKDSAFQAQKKKRDENIEDLARRLAAGEQSLVSELNDVGIKVRSVWDLVNTSEPYDNALPVLHKHLSFKRHPKIVSGIARALAMPRIISAENVWGELCQLYVKTPSDDEIEAPELRGSAQSIAIALEALATKERVDDLRKLVREKPRADGVHWLEGAIKKLSP